jgi:hypothetical protein
MNLSFLVFFLFVENSEVEDTWLLYGYWMSRYVMMTNADFALHDI